MKRIKKEERFYPLVKKALENQFKPYAILTDFEITHRGRIPDRFLKDRMLRKQKGLLPTPDIMGLVWRKGQEDDKKLVIAEVKLNPTFWDIFQAKGYDELFDSDITYLIGVAKSISKSYPRIFDFVKERPWLLKTKCGKSQIFIRLLHITHKGVPTLGILGSEVEMFSLHEVIESMFLVK